MNRPVKARDVSDITAKGGVAAAREFLDGAKTYQPDDEAAQSESKANGEAKITPFDTFDARDWQDQPIEPRLFTVLDWIPAGEPGLVSGDGGTGKTRLMLQLATGIAAEWPDWVGKLIQIHGPALVFSAEERRGQMHRIVKDILDSRGQTFSDLKHGLHFICDEEDVTLGRADRDGTVKPTLSLLRLEKTIAAVRPAFVVIENASEVFVGDERVRGPVAAFVRKLLGGLTQPSNTAVALIQHPSLSGLQDGTGRAGSTGWRNAGRWQHNFTSIKSGDDEDSDLRQLQLGKINYGRPGEKLQLRWERGVFVPVGVGNSLQRTAAEASVEEAFLRCLDAATAQGRRVSPNHSSAYAPTVFEKMPEAGGIKKVGMEKAMERLFAASRIKVDEGPRGTRQIVRTPQR
jgi:RecA-family ATPase